MATLKHTIIVVSHYDDEFVEQVLVKNSNGRREYSPFTICNELPLNKDLESEAKKEYSAYVPQSSNHEFEFFKFGMHWILEKMGINNL
jgi:hypothetical protein